MQKIMCVLLEMFLFLKKIIFSLQLDGYLNTVGSILSLVLLLASRR